MKDWIEVERHNVFILDSSNVEEVEIITKCVELDDGYIIKEILSADFITKRMIQ